jgi:phosphate transport system substrate-binding protein
MKRLLFLALLLFNTVEASAEVLGIGATFPLPVMNAWLNEYSIKGNPTVVYKGLGSGEGIKRITANTIEFAITDIPLTESELNQANLLQLPLVASGILPVINVPNLNKVSIKISGLVLADIFLGKISNWNDPRIVEINPEIQLPNLAIKVIHREEASGTSFTFTNYLSKVSPVWEQTLGIGSRIIWPVGVGVRGNDGIAQKVSQTPGAIGYVEYSNAQKYGLGIVTLKNADGQYVYPSITTFESAFKKVIWSRPNFYQMLTNQSGENSWPIIGVSYVLLQKNQNKSLDLENTIRFIEWIYGQGNVKAWENSYLLVNQEPVISRIRSELNLVNHNRAAGKK